MVSATIERQALDCLLLTTQSLRILIQVDPDFIIRLIAYITYLD